MRFLLPCLLCFAALAIAAPARTCRLTVSAGCSPAEVAALFPGCPDLEPADCSCPSLSCPVPSCPAPVVTIASTPAHCRKCRTKRGVTTCSHCLVSVEAVTP